MTPTGTEARVCALIAERQAVGLKKYGTTVEGNPLPLRDWLMHSLLEKLDDAIYMMRAIEEIDARVKDCDDLATLKDVPVSYYNLISTGNTTMWRCVGSHPEFGYGDTTDLAKKDYIRRNLL